MKWDLRPWTCDCFFLGCPLTFQSGSTHHVLDDFVFAILPLDFQKMVAEIKEVKAALLSQQHDDGAAGPIQPITKALPVNVNKNNKQ